MRTLHVVAGSSQVGGFVHGRDTWGIRSRPVAAFEVVGHGG